MPHLDVYALDTDLTGHEQTLIAGLTDAVATVYGEWARPGVVVRLFGLPPTRWAVGGHAGGSPAPAVTFGIRADALTRPDTPAILSALASGVTAALAGALGAHLHDAITVEFVPRPAAHLAVGGKLSG
jgi:phenylpyruvate tautomerase PptA (4-oxalocrotonate tautomerase family)